MEALRRIIAKINAQMSDLSASQRLAIGLCVVLIVGSFMWLLQWSSEPQYVRLLDQPLSVEQLRIATEKLPAEKFKLVGDEIWVTPQDRHAILFQLQNAGGLPADTTITFSKLIEDESPFRPESENHFRRRVALQNELAKVIASSPLVRSAEVFITDSTDRRINSPNMIPTASIKLTLFAGHSINPEMVNACASLASGAVPGLLPHNVSVIDGATLRTYRVPDPQDAFSQGQLQEKQNQEEHLRRKLQDQLAYIPGVRVSVSAQLDSSRKQTRELAYADPAVAEEQTTSTDSTTTSGGGESGVGPNVGQSLSSAGSGGRDTSEESRTKFQEQSLSKETTTQHAPYSLVRATASVGVPRSYVVSVLKKLGGGDVEPTQEQIDQRFETEKRRVVASVKTMLMAEAESDVTVDLFPDLEPSMTVLPDGSLAVGAVTAGGVDVMSMLKEYGPQGILALLAMTGLLMLSRLSKRAGADADAQSAARKSRPGEEPAELEDIMAVGSKPVGMVSPSDGGVLEAPEIDEDVIRAKQLTDQVVQLVNQDPSTVARILHRWTEALD